MGHFRINNYCTLFGENISYDCLYKFGSAGQKLWAEIPVCTHNTAVGVCGYVRCLNLVTAPITMSPILKAPWVTLIPWQSLHMN